MCSLSYLRYKFVENRRVFKVFDIMNMSFDNGEQKLLQELYIFQNAIIDMIKAIDGALAWDQNNIVIFEGDLYYVIRLQQKPCDRNKKFVDTVKHFGPFLIKDIDSSNDDLSWITSAVRYKSEDKNLVEFYLFENHKCFYYNNPTMNAVILDLQNFSFYSLLFNKLIINLLSKECKNFC